MTVGAFFFSFQCLPFFEVFVSSMESLPTPFLEALCAFLTNDEITRLRCCCSELNRKIGGSYNVKRRLEERNRRYHEIVEPERLARRRRWKEYAEEQKRKEGIWTCLLQ